ncbi:pentapeptide repeat-containing protein [Agreia bicolorata]|uniref:pentapeptide repeat-containing protein n=1 Tax=Agreia bicolorata TaxID=110935 RepID=UPI000A014E02|nr:pentapeptide repeat-containing protein [Agreia bicolorata]
MARRFAIQRGRIPMIVAVTLGTLALAAAPATAANAEVFYDEGGCVVQQVTDGAPAGGSQCAGVDFGGTSMGQAAFMGANLAGANLSGSKLQAANFTGANIEGANFTDAQVDGADFTDAGILPGTITAEATDANGAPINFAPVVPAGLTAGDCMIVDVPVVSGTVFPIGDSGMVCKFSSSNGTAIAVVKIQVTPHPEATEAPTPLFTDEPTTTGTTASTRQPTDWGLVAAVGGGAVVVLALGVAAMVISRRRPAIVAGEDGAGEESAVEPDDDEEPKAPGA